MPPDFAKPQASLANIRTEPVSLRTFWRSKGPVNLLLLPISALFALATAIRRLCYRTGVLRVHRMPVPVVVVGGITAGGGGKTPFTIALTRQLAVAGLHPGVVCRGYCGDATRPTMVEPDMAAATCGDEPLLVRCETKAPVCVGANRALAARMLLERHPATNIIISDDGLQHMALGRDWEIAVIDPNYGLGNGWPMPAGPLREPRSRLNSVNLVTGRPDDAAAIKVMSSRLLRLDSDRTEIGADELKGKIVAIAGIANPERFFDTLEAAGLILDSRIAFPDHHPYQDKDLLRITADHIVMTAKDAVKCRSFADRRCLEWNVVHTVDSTVVATVASLAYEPKDT